LKKLKENYRLGLSLGEFRSAIGGTVVLSVLFATTLISCASLPELRPLQPTVAVDSASAGKSVATVATSATSTIQLKSAAGTLTAKQSQLVLDRLDRGAPDTGIFERHLALENALSSEPLTTGNKVALFQDGRSTYAAMDKAILAAKDHINVETYIIEDDEIGQAFIKSLVDKQSAGVQVNLIYDSVGSIDTPRTFFEA